MACLSVELSSQSEMMIGHFNIWVIFVKQAALNSGRFLYAE